ncbi:MAG: hypothetical protein DRH76_11060 [Deltaproteobacteria bacterium]|nr:MAG: hypothetical protein DRH76_11060 [Deltaproteobacteria bacterium]
MCIIDPFVKSQFPACLPNCRFLTSFGMTLEDGEKRMNREVREEKQVWLARKAEKDILRS